MQSCYVLYKISNYENNLWLNLKILGEILGISEKILFLGTDGLKLKLITQLSFVLVGKNC